MSEVEQSDVKKALLEALEAHYGIVTDAVRKVGIARSTFYEWLKNDPEFKASVDDIQEVALDFVESKLFERINGVEVLKGVDKETGEEITYALPPDVHAIGIYLRTKGKKRGYVERQEITPTDPNGNALTQPLINITVVQPNE